MTRLHAWTAAGAALAPYTADACDFCRPQVIERVASDGMLLYAAALLLPLAVCVAVVMLLPRSGDRR